MNVIAEPKILLKDLDQAFDNKDLYMEYQPKINIKSGKTTGSEALIRWNHPQFGYVSPALFIPIAVENNLSAKLANFVVNSVCQQVKQWEQEKVPLPSVSFNLSPVIFSNPSLVDMINQIFQKHQVSPRLFEIEITEDALLQNNQLVHKQFTLLKELGFRFALDDLGKGYTSFTTLTEFPFDTVKIDRSYISEIDKSNDSRYIVKSFIEISKRIGKKVVAEGVEKKEQLQILQELKCDEIQGFYYSPSVSGSKMAEWYKRENLA